MYAVLCCPLLCSMQYEEIGEEVVGKLDGMFAFVLLNEKDGSYIACRDAIGICPLYIGWGRDGTHHRICPLCIGWGRDGMHHCVRTLRVRSCVDW